MESINKMQQDLVNHPVYRSLNTLKAIQEFMRFHVFAVWDFMSLLKSLQRQITCVDLPWKPSSYPAEMVRLINQIVLGEESDLDQKGTPTSHFELYLKAMEEVGAPTAEIHDFLATLEINRIPKGAQAFVRHNLEVANRGSVVEVASSFFFGREKLIPEMFQMIVDTLKKEGLQAPTFLYYLERHIEVDAEEHGPLALKCLDYLTSGSENLKELALSSGVRALEERKKLWDEVLRVL